MDIAEVLRSAKDPIYFYDDDVDGLCSYLLCKKALGEGVGVVVKRAVDREGFFRQKLVEHNPDMVVVLDIPELSQEFINSSPTVVWIDHHPAQQRDRVHYYNPRIKNPDQNKPTTQLCYELLGGPLWLCMVGMVGDWCFDDELVKKFRETDAELLPEEITDPGTALFTSPVGLLSKVFNFCLKGKIKDVKMSVKTLEKIKDPYEILQRTTPEGAFIYKRFEEHQKVYDQLLRSAEDRVDESDDLLVYVYDHTNTYTGELSNELLFKHPDKIIIVGRQRSGEMRCSLRSSKYNMRDILERALIGVEGRGGGHEHACGAGVAKADWKRFLENIRNHAHSE